MAQSLNVVVQNGTFAPCNGICLEEQSDNKYAYARISSSRQLFLYPQGNNVKFVSVYLRSVYDEGYIPEDWYACAQFAVVLWNPNKPSQYTSKGSGSTAFIMVNFFLTAN